MNTSSIGVVFDSLTPPEELTDGAALAERLGFGELWFSEDCFFTGGLTGLTQLLAATRMVPAGLGLASVMTRHPAILAMELAGLARMHPGCSRATVGLGNSHWLRQMGLLPERPLTAVMETFDVLRDVLSGATVDRRTSTHEFDNIRLEFPPELPPELWIGAVNERALRAAGAKADGVLLSALAGPSYATWAKEQVAAAGRAAPPITAFVLASVSDDDRAAREAVRDVVGFFLRAESHTALVGQSKHGAEIREQIARLADDEPLVVEDVWIDEFAIAGDPDRVAGQLQELLAAGPTPSVCGYSRLSNLPASSSGSPTTYSPRSADQPPDSLVLHGQFLGVTEDELTAIVDQIILPLLRPNHGMGTVVASLTAALDTACSPHLFLPDGTNYANPGIDVHYTADYGVGFPIVTADDPSIYHTLLKHAATG